MSAKPPPARTYEQRELIYVAISRVLAVPLFLALIAISGEGFDAGVWIVAALAFAYVGATLWLAASDHWNRIDARVLILADLVTIAAGLNAAGGPEAQVQTIFYVWTLAMALLYPPRTVLLCAAAAMAVNALASAPFLGEEAALRALGLSELMLAWIGVVTFLVADSFHRRQERIGRLSEARRSLLADALSAEDRARRRLSQNLHDDALQTLLAAGQDLDAGIADDDRSQLERARDELRSTVKGLRETIRGLHPAALEHGGLAGGLDAVTERAANQGGFAVDLRVDPSAGGWHDALIVSVVRELLTNAVKHSEATRVVVGVDRVEGAIGVEVADDGRGMADSSREAALATGHIGLASARERVEAVGGAMRIASAPDRGTRVTFSLPLPPGANGSAQAARSIARQA